ncbi:MAG: putative small integral membrane protein [Paraglaciecola sp.]|jgi:predicted small integral membrane protein
MSWMAWTSVTGTFFSVIAAILVFMTIYEIKSPCVERKGFLPIATTRGDRLFISLITSAFIHLGYLATTDASLWIALIASLIWSAIVFRWG